jgi:diguanylate cyclase (GGDEF)-like protein
MFKPVLRWSSQIERSCLRRLRERSAPENDLFVASIHVRTIIPIVAALTILQCAFIVLGPSFVENRTKAIFLPFGITIVIGLVLALYKISRGNLDHAKIISAGTVFAACAFAVFFTGGPLKSVASPILIALPIIYMCIFGFRHGPIVAVSVPFFVFLGAAAIKIAGVNLPDFTSRSSESFNVIAVFLTTYGLAVAAVWILLKTNAGLQDKLETEGERLYQLSHTDALTGLANRLVFAETLERALARPLQYENVGLIAFDLDHFKSVNDTFGHSVGDELLQQAAQRIQELVPNGGLFARIGGDEFCLIIFDAEAPALEDIARLIVGAMSDPFEIQGATIISGASVGVALPCSHGEDADQLMKSADLALYDAKARGRHRAVVYHPKMGEDARMLMQVELDLHQAVPRGELQLHFQPIVDSRSRKVACREALVRWDHPTRGLIMPDAFIDIAERNGMIDVIGEWVLRNAIAQAASWDDDVSIAINLSSVQVRNERLLSVVLQALASSGLRPERLELEVTESAFLQDSDRNVRALHALRDLGIKVALDDFGTGYSSLNYLRCFPFDKVKIDRGFVQEIGINTDAEKIIRSTIDLARSLGMRTTAEGVENDIQAAFLLQGGCDHFQGHLFGKAVAMALPPKAAGQDFLPKQLSTMSSDQFKEKICKAG